MGISYELCLLEEETGSPERPISDLGFKAFLSYWTQRLINYLLSLPDSKLAEVTITSLSKATAVSEKDILKTFEAIKLVRYKPNDKTPHICLEKNLLHRKLKEAGRSAIPVIKENIIWAPHKFKP